MECKICFNAYSDISPPTILQCGHTLCTCCLFNLKSRKCPFDRVQIKSTSLNFDLISLIRKTSGFSLFQRTIKEIKLSDFCPSNHSLYLSELHDSSLAKCNSCNETTSSATWHCSTCNYDLCHLCKGEVLCCSGHLMNEALQSPFKCDGCLMEFNEKCKRCALCDVDLCLRCCRKYFDVWNKRDFCAKGHVVKWRPKIQNVCKMEGKRYFTCNTCKKKISKFGAFSCLHCKVNTCLACA